VSRRNNRTEAFDGPEVRGLDPVAFARQNGLELLADAVGSWLWDLDQTTDGQRFVINLTRDDSLIDLATGRSALTELINGAARWRTAGGTNACAWIQQLLTAREETMLCQGRLIPVDENTDKVCRVITYETFRARLTQQRMRDDSNDLGLDETLSRQRQRRFASTPEQFMAALDKTQMIRGRLPIAFASPSEDRTQAWPGGTGAPRVWQVLGVSGEPVDSCVLTFRRSRLACIGHIPSALDAFTHENFLAPETGATWGRTKDLASPTGAGGVRECVLRQFLAEFVDMIEFVEA
jgi:hypothetical protein